VLHRLDSPELPRALNGSVRDDDGVKWQAEIEQTKAKLDELAELWAEGVIGRSEWLKARAPLDKRQTLAKKRLAALNRTTALTPHIGDANGLREKWSEMNLTRQHQIVAALLDHVVVGPARRGYNRFDSSRLRPVWRV
jgi:site-specific DNA recombinase